MKKYNRHIFDTIDTPEKAYWLGFIIADGYLNINRRMLRIKLGDIDKSHLIKYIEFLDGDKFNFVDVSEGDFVIFYPNDVHAPMLSVKEPINIKKVIVKIAI